MRELDHGSSHALVCSHCQKDAIHFVQGGSFDWFWLFTPEGIVQTRKLFSASSNPSPKAEPFKRWLAKVGYERVQEIEDPELASHRARALYKAKGYPDAWIEKRMLGIQIRSELTEMFVY